MRVIGGAAGGVRLETLPDPALRPMLDRVKESLFNILRGEVAGAPVLDLFSGSGALGLEALSRGAESCVFVESSSTLVELIRRNAAKCRLSDRCVLLQQNVWRLPRQQPPPKAAPAEIIFVDPPYQKTADPNARADLFAVLEGLIGTWTTEEALWMLHHEPIPYALWPGGRLTETEHRIYGRSQLTFFELAER